MSAIATLIAFDGAAIPVSHSLLAVAVSKDKDTIMASWREALGTVPVFSQVRCQATFKELPSGVVRLALRTEVPVMESISGQNASGYTAAPQVAFTDTLETVAFFSKRSTQVSRRLARQLHVNILNGVAISVTPILNGPAPEMFDYNVMPT